MKVIKPSTKLVEIGHLDGALRLPMEARILRGMGTKCCVCGKQITDKTFIAGFKDGEKNMLIHESCVPVDDPAMIALHRKENGL